MTPPSDSDSGTSSGGGGPTEVVPPLAEATARRLVVAIELLARRLQVGSDAAGAFANRDRTAEGRSHPAMSTMLVAAAAATSAGAAATSRPVPYGESKDVTVINPEGRPVPVVVVGWKADLPDGGGSRQIGDVQDADVKVLGTSKSLPAADPKALPGPASTSPKPPAAPPEREPTPWDGTGMWNLQRRNFDVGAMKEALWRPRGGEPEPKKRKEPEKESGDGIAKALAAQFGRVLAPLLAFSTVLSASNSGMSVFQKSVSVLATSLAPILLPPLVLLSAGLLTISDVIWTKLRPHLAAWAELVTTSLVPAIEEAVANFADLVDAIQWVVEVAKDPTKLVTGTDAGKAKGKNADQEGVDNMLTIGRHLPGVGGVFDLIDRARKSTAGDRAGAARTAAEAGVDVLPGGAALRRWVFGGGSPGQAAQEASRRGGQPAPAGPQPAGPQTAGDRLRARLAEQRATRANPPAGGAGGAAGGGFAGNVDAVLTSLTRSLGPKAEFTSAAGAARARQLAGANGDPLDMKALLRAIESVREVTAGVRAGVDKADPPTPQVPPGGGRN